MTETAIRSIIIIAICAACTFAERALPFVVFRNGETPPVIKYLGKALPAAIIATLIIYCVRSISFSTAASFLPQLIASAVTVALHLWKRSTLLSILGGTLCCMLLTQLVF